MLYQRVEIYTSGAYQLPHKNLCEGEARFIQFLQLIAFDESQANCAGTGNQFRGRRNGPGGSA